jgi:sugar phosphate permease
MEDRSTATRARRKIFFGWKIVAAGAVMNALAGGAFWTGFAVYFLPVTRDFGVSRAATSLIHGLGRLEGGFEGPLAGYLVDRFGPRAMVAFGGAMGGLGFILLGLTHNFTMFLLVYVGVLSVGMNAGFNHGTGAAVNQWFARRRGLAMSITYMGQSVGGAVITPAVAFIVLSAGWRPAAIISGVVMVIVVVPLSLVIRRSPESMGLLPDGDQAQSEAPKSVITRRPSRFGRHITTVDFTAKEAFRTRSFWLLTLAMGLRIAATSGTVVHLVPLVVWKGQTEATGALVVAFIAFTAIPLRVILGWIGDKWAKQKMVGITMFLGAASLITLLLPGGGVWRLLVFALLFAFPEGVIGMCWSLVGDFYGRRSFATLRGVANAAGSFLSAGTPVFLGWVFDTTGSYHNALMPMIGLYLVTALIFWNLPRAKVPSRVADSMALDPGSA